ncbi:MAG: response regulator transcription factor [Bacteroidetes bacterium]|nr:response regulator transcription factor [Bacteroidota bacterium]MBU1113761.1 response regulator transcription factor [Bacteroidota bacterium]MBU1800491.1 response regulator transcription factor [Bacteroidota bacterium]
MNEIIKILLVEDDPNLGSLIKEFLEIKDYKVKLAVDGIEGGKAFNNDGYDLIILDIMMPRKDGFTLAREIRKIDEEIPLIFLTAKSLQVDKIEGFKIGADDYITKPFSMEELFLRIAVILKRSIKKENYNEIITIGKYKYDISKQTLAVNNSLHKLTSKETQLLALLISRKGEVVSRSEALRKIWKSDSYFNSRSMDVYISKLRGLLKEDNSIEIINIHGEGFKIIY